MSKDMPEDVMNGISGPEIDPNGPQLPPGLTVAAVRAQLERVLASEYFAHSERLSRFLRFAVEQVLNGQENKLKEYLIGVEVFDRQESFDPRIDSIVRVEARRLRSKLDQFYESDGREDTIQIQFRKGRYVPSFRNRQRHAGTRFSEVLSISADRDWRAIAVLPFESLSQDPSNELFADGLTQEIMACLTKIPGVRVAARTSSFQYRERYPDVRRIGEELRVDALLTGSVRREGDRARITAHLVHVSEGYYVWSDSYDCEVRDVFGAQEEIARKILAAVSEKLGAQPEPVPTEPLTGQSPSTALFESSTAALARLDPEQLERAGRQFDDEIRMEPANAEAIAGLYFTLSLRMLLGMMNPEEARRNASGHLAKLRQCGDGDPSAAFALALAHAAGWNWTAAEEAFARAIRLQPEDAAVRGSYGVFLTVRGQLNEGLEELRLAEELAPGSALVSAAIGWTLYLKRDAARAAERFRTALTVEPAMAVALCGSADACMLRLAHAEAVEFSQKAVEVSSGAGFARTVLARALVSAGRRMEGERLLGEILVDARRRYISPARIASVYVSLGQMDRALERLESAIPLRCPELLWLPSDPAYDPIRADGRFGLLLEKLAADSSRSQPGMTATQK